MTISIPKRTIPPLTKTVIITAGTSWTVPSDWNNSNNIIHCIGAGGGAMNGGGGSGGSGGAYAAKLNVSLTPGASVTIRIGAGGGASGDGGNTVFGGTSLASCTCGAQGGGGAAIYQGAPSPAGQATNSVGDVRYSGGIGGDGTGTGSGGYLGGGGGAAGPNGNGGAGGAGLNNWSGAGGGGCNGGSDGNPSVGTGGADGTGGDGGNNRFGTGGGAHGTGGSGTGQPGTNGGGGGGSTAGSADNGGAGSMEVLWTDNSGGTNNGLTAGPGSGGGGGGNGGGNSSVYGGGGGSGGHSGANGVIVAQYTVDGTDTGNLVRTQNQSTQNQVRFVRDSLMNGLIGWWKFDDASGTTAIDSSGSGVNGTLTNGPTWTTGHINGAITFDGTDDIVTTSNTSFADNLTNMTVAAWIYTGDTNARPLITKCASFDDPGWDFSIGQNGSGKISFFVTEDGVSNWHGRYSSSVTINDYTWHHVAVTLSGGGNGTITLYIDGVAVTMGSDDGGTNTTYTSPTSISFGGFPGGYVWNGSLDDVRIYNRVLTGSEISQLAAM